jgi:hypothetical protein
VDVPSRVGANWLFRFAPKSINKIGKPGLLISANIYGHPGVGRYCLPNLVRKQALIAIRFCVNSICSLYTVNLQTRPAVACFSL